MASAAQIKANRENAQHSSGPTSEAGKKASSRNNIRHGLTGHVFLLLEWEDPEGYDVVKNYLITDHKPATPTEKVLVDKMAQAYWLAQRAQQLQTFEMNLDPLNPDLQKLAHLARYQAHHERVFRGALNDLLKLRAERRKEQIGFESQQSKQAQETRREAAETRKTETHQKTIEILETRLKREKNKTMQAEIETADKMYQSLGPEGAQMLAGNMQKHAA
jgi:hypothetical protein